ncbi:CAD17 protein, partial [Amia calva]|nr:CAD17 protein [Amia calva]
SGEPFMKVFATDLDDPSTSHGKLRFSILNQIPDRLKVPLFQIDQLTGDISTTPEGTEALKARTPFMIHQEEEEDSLQSLMRKFDAYCIPRQNVTYDMNPFFTCVQRKGGLRVDPQIDADYTLIIAVKDLEGLSENALSGSTKVNIVVKQNLWVAPKPLSIPENWPEVHPFQITQVQWNEPGAVYVLAQKERYPKFPFTIDIEGRIFLTEHLDREEEDMYVLVVFVRDEYNNDLDRPLEIHITVEDENDNAPVCEEKETVFEVQENEKIGNEIGNLKVTDLDEENTENSLLSYQIKSQEPKHPFPSMFSIDENLGKIQIENAHFQKREFPQYNLTVKVSDKGGKASGLITECKIVIKIIDINNQIPIFQKSQYEPITKSEDTAVGTTLLSLQATDNDDPGTGSSKIVYTVGEGDPEGVFAINTNEETNEGYLYIVKPLDFEAQSLHRLRIDARNPEPLVSGVNYNSSSSTFVTINVTDVNEAPVFDSVIYQETVLEDLAVGTVILNVHANDPEHTKISYRLEDDIFNWLEVNPDTGDISSKASLDREKTDVYNVRVIAREKEIPYQETEVQVTIYLNDINDNIPKLTMQNPEAVFCYPLGEPKVILLEATDPDLSPFGAPLTFSIDDKYSLDWKIEQINGKHTFILLILINNY